jgi:hypothetical protein
MSDTSIAIKIAGAGTRAHASAWTSDDETWIKQLSDSEKVVRIRMPEDEDTEGHQVSTAVTVLVDSDDDDVEGHALNLHFPSVQEANEFRRNLMVAGLLTATLAVGAAGGAAIGMAASGIDANQASVVSSEYAPNVGQYDATNMGGTLAQSSSLGQYDATNMGGTLAQSSSLGQADPANMGGTLAQSSSLGQADPANMGGTLAQSSSLGQADPANMGGTLAQRTGSLGQADPANMGGTPQSDASDDDDIITPPGT